MILPAGNKETPFFSGLASRWFASLTRTANGCVSDLHDRMPVVLNAEERDAWLGGSEDLGLGAGARLRHYPVQSFGIADEGWALIEPITP